MSKETDIFDHVGTFFKSNPKYFGIFILLVGIFGLLASIFNWDLVFKGRTYNTQKIVGTANMWGRGYARFKLSIGGIVCIIFGIIWFIIF